MKSKVRSKTLWFSVAIATLGAVEAQANIIPAEFRGYTLILIAAVTAYLRIVTSEALR